MFSKTEKNTDGFTLIEVMITIAIIGIVSFFSIRSLSSAKLKTEVEGSARQLATAIREAQNYALTGKNITTVTGARPCQFRVRAANGAAVFFVEQSNIGSCGTFSGPTYRLSNAVTLALSSEVRFDVPRGEPKNAAGAELTGASRVDFSVTKGGFRAHVCVYPLGRVEEKAVGAIGSEPGC